MVDLGTSDLEALRAVAKHRSFRGAARHLGCAPSSLSHVVANLERRLGVRLFNRSTRSVALTDQGSAFLARVSPALDEIADAVGSLARTDGELAGTLRIASSLGASERLLPTVLRFLESNPRMEVRLIDDGRLVDIVADGYDAGLRLREAVPLDMVAVPLGGDEAFAVVGSPDYLRSREAPRSQRPFDVELRCPCAGGRAPRLWPRICHRRSRQASSPSWSPGPIAGRLDTALRRPLPLLSRPQGTGSRPEGVRRVYA